MLLSVEIKTEQKEAKIYERCDTSMSQSISYHFF